MASALLDNQAENPSGTFSLPKNRILGTWYALLLALSISTWFIAIRAPLWLDETISFSQISDGLSRVWSRSGGIFPAYPYILWLTTRVSGTSEVALRIPSVLAAFAAAYLLYRASRELLPRETALIATIIFCSHPLIVFACTNARPYGFAVLAINASVFILLRLRHTGSLWMAAALGVTSAAIVYFQFLFAVILPGLAICFIVFKIHDCKMLLAQGSAALASFAMAILPIVPGALFIFRTGGTHVQDVAPTLADLLWTLAPPWVVIFFGLLAIISLSTERPLGKVPFKAPLVLCWSLLGVIPALVLYIVSTTTPLHIFPYRYRLVAIPLVALFWGAVATRIGSRDMRVLFCLGMVATVTLTHFLTPGAQQHGYTWKYALEFADRNASTDNASLLICSDLPESNFIPMPLDSAKDSPLFAPLSYYKLSVPVVPLPRALNAEAIRVASAFLQEASRRHRRFLALAYSWSYPTLLWLQQNSSHEYSSRELAVFDEVKVVEFTPLVRAENPRSLSGAEISPPQSRTP